MDYPEFYASIDKPFFAPEPWVFGLAWGIIYPLIGIAFIYALYLAWRHRITWTVIGVFIVNIIANLAFTPLQLNFPGQIYATSDIFIVLGSLVFIEWYFWKKSRLLLLLLSPYLLWGSFATVLQVTIYILNFV